MEYKNQFVLVGLLAVFAIFGSPSSQSAQSCLEMPGKLHLVSVNGEKPEGYEHEINHDNRIKLNEKASQFCFEGEFCVEESSIKTTYFFNTWTKIGRGSMTAVVNCLE
jgi:hypothetical protein